jgi:hypothetical protein
MHVKVGETLCGAAVTFSRCSFVGNVATSRSGGGLNVGLGSGALSNISVVVEDCEFLGNVARGGCQCPVALLTLERSNESTCTFT